MARTWATLKSRGLSGQPPFVSRVGHPLLENHSHAGQNCCRAVGSVFSFDLKAAGAGARPCRGAQGVQPPLANVGDCRAW
jgi:O-acetylhomoserine/O-acetylserine sulfhydrylase-like pyridoxal-dependent enzyme